MTETPQQPEPIVAAVRDLVLAGERFRHVMAEHTGIGVSETVVLSYLQSAGGQLTPREIGERALMTSGTLSAVLDRLESANMVTRTPNPDDRRSVLVSLIPPGRRALAYARREMTDAVMAAFTGEVSDQTIEDVSAIALSMSNRVEELRAVEQPSIDG